MWFLVPYSLDHNMILGGSRITQFHILITITKCSLIMRKTCPFTGLKSGKWLWIGSFSVQLQDCHCCYNNHHPCLGGCRLCHNGKLPPRTQTLEMLLLVNLWEVVILPSQNALHSPSHQIHYHWQIFRPNWDMMFGMKQNYSKCFLCFHLRGQCKSAHNITILFPLSPFCLINYMGAHK